MRADVSALVHECGGTDKGASALDGGVGIAFDSTQLHVP